MLPLSHFINYFIRFHDHFSPYLTSDDTKKKPTIFNCYLHKLIDFFKRKALGDHKW